jgi:LysR family transcriptional regulator, cys regulon transcriptional activator
VREAVRRGYDPTEVARVLHTSQPGVSRRIRKLEEELGIDLFVRAGKRLTFLTEVGRQVVPIVENMLNDAENLRRAGEESTQQATGRLSIAATHSQARYALPMGSRTSANAYDEERDLGLRAVMPVISSRSTSRSSACGAAASCAATSTISSRPSRRR